MKNAVLDPHTGSAQPDVVHVIRKPHGSLDDQDRRRMRLTALEIVLGVSVPVILLGLWETASRLGWISEVLFPPPSKIFPAGIDLAQSGQLIDATGQTLRVILAGFVIGSCAGLVVGIACGTTHLIRAALEPLLSALYVVPKLALLPIFLLTLGFGDPPKIALVSVTVFFYVWIQTMEAVSSIPNGYLETAHTFDLNGRQMLSQIYLPATLPMLFVGFRIAMSSSVLVTIAGEFVIGGQGLGFMIFNARNLMHWRRCTSESSGSPCWASPSRPSSP
ncbi:ABC transporter permease [Aeromicrobium sp. UC242_57]|uniref:ABC transporter permease n=1 Tax=Aeromicrobium sp. UC242_57 TaxID=3374624 RepID=UPI0037AFCC04